MEESSAPTVEKRNIWARGILMMLIVIPYYLASTVLFFLGAIQFILTLINDAPNHRLQAFGRSLGRYLGQIADFGSFATEALPFPFTDWPSGKPKSSQDK